MSVIEQLATPEQRAEIQAWFDTWGKLVAAVDYESARDLFHPEAIGFGTYMEYVRGLDQLEARQWRSIWGTIDGFHFPTERLVCGVSPDGQHAWGIVPWASTGFHEDGTAYDRPGRATVLFVRDGADSRWLAIHTHMSLSPGTPQRSFGKPQTT